MTIKKKLISGVLFVLVGIGIIIAVSAYALLEIKSTIDLLTHHSTPLQIMTVHLQEIIEKLSADFLRIGITYDTQEIADLSASIDRHIKNIQVLSGDIAKLSAQHSPADADGFKKVHRTILDAANSRLHNAATYKNQATQVSKDMSRIETAVSGIRANIVTLEGEAVKTMSQAQQANMNLNSSIKRLLTLQTKLKDIQSIVSDLDSIKNKFKLSPVKERIKAVSDSITGVRQAPDDPAVIKELKDFGAAAYDQFVKEGSGLLFHKAALLSSQGSEETYTNAKNALLKSLDRLYARTYETVDAMEMDLLKDKERVEKAIGLQNNAAAITLVSHAISIDQKELVSAIRLLMLSDTASEVDKITAGVRSTEEHITEKTERLKKMLAQANQPKMIREAEGITQVMKSVAPAIGQIIEAKKSLMQSELVLQEAVKNIKAVSDAYSKKGEEHTRATAQQQQEVVTQVNSKVKQALGFIILLSLFVFGVLLTVNGTLAFSITRPLTAMVAAVKTAEEKGDFSRRLNIKTRDEVGEAATAFDSLLASLQVSVDNINKVMRSVAQGEFSEKVDAELKGDLDRLKGSINNSVANVNTIIGDINRVLKAVADNDLTSRVITEARGDLNTLKTSVNETIESLIETMKKIGSNARRVATASTESSQAVTQVSQGSQHQAETIRQIAAAISQTTAAIQEVAENTESASRSAWAATQIVEQSREAIHFLKRVMGDISENSQKINKITEVITGIAHQTNLLSLNAAIEAARAGEQGKSFAVVADQVRNLAAHSAHSAKEIAELVEHAVTATHNGVEATDKATSNMEKVVQSVQVTNDRLLKVATAMEQTSASMQEVNGNVNTLRTIGETNASAAEAIAASVAELSLLAEQTRIEVEKFQVEPVTPHPADRYQPAHY